MVGYLPHCTFNLNPRAASIDTPLHAYVPRPHVDHMHPDAIIAIAASVNSRPDAEDFRRPDRLAAVEAAGVRAGLWLENSAPKNPEAQGVVLESHGLFTWGR
jgi:rhamnose utilization protein RhaD (predicted bifunctional aldolase and dehydrogenase)